ncbi:metallophosphoesterase family protein [Nissabacter archeti]|uniref:metallophosphoesterase family protein n=1 Tax=Nissabacter archeti TaxID=1917880 RepID=UPI0009354AF1|nr:metallophosphoesterase [Nissabacter archeti]
MKKIIQRYLALLAVVTGSVAAADTSPYRIAFMPDIHFHDVYGQFADGAFAGLKNSKSGRPAVIRTMYAQLTSTRLFNENYFALRAALDDAGRKGIKLVALPGDFSDDGQSLHLRGLVSLLQEYGQRYGMRFFATPGNHDPNRPFDSPGGEEDFLGQGGQTQRIFSRGAKECSGYAGRTALINTGAGLPTLCSEEMASRGYEYVMKAMGPFGLTPSPADRYWETPYSDYHQQPYRYQAALQASDFGLRQYEICTQGTGGRYKQPGYGSCFMVADSSYLVEPVPGLWLLAVDANVYVPDEKADAGKPGAAGNFAGSGEAGYNKMLTHKQQTVAWMASVAQRAKAEHKTLVTFSHFPMVEFDNGAMQDMEALFGEGTLQLTRAPRQETSYALAKTGIGVHVGGHMHFNDTGVRRYPDGSVLVNIQAPSLAAYVPAYKILSIKNRTEMEVQTVILGSVPRFNELFEHYQQEWDYLNASHSPHLWNKAILTAPDYYAFTDWHITELTRLRFLPEEWPCDIRQMLFSLNGKEMLILSQSAGQITYRDILGGPPGVAPAQCASGSTPRKGEITRRYSQENPVAWENARQKAQALAQQAGLTLEDFARWNGFDLAVDFYRLRNADELALRDISAARLRQYHLLTGSLAATLPPATQKINDKSRFDEVFRLRFGTLFRVLDKYLHGQPSRNFRVNLQSGEITPL